jgi:hypothetical protein
MTDTQSQATETTSADRRAVVVPVDGNREVDCRARDQLSGERAGAATAGKEHDLQPTRLALVAIVCGGHTQIMPCGNLSRANA